MEELTTEESRYDRRKLIGATFNRMHQNLSLLREHCEALNDPVTMKLYEAMEFGLLVPMLKLRKHLDIPYHWHHAPRVNPGE